MSFAPGRRSDAAVAGRLVLVGLHLLSGMAQIALLYPFLGDARRDALKKVWSRQLLSLLGVRVDALGGDDVRHGLLVCNHVSFIDIFVINALLPSGFVAKSEVARWPVIGWLSRHSGTVFIERGSRRAAHQTQARMQDSLAAGKRLAIFPEGTTSDGRQVLPFHAALLQSAVDAGAEVHALTLSYHDRHGAHSTAPAYVGETSLMECVLATLRAGGLSARIGVTAHFPPPHADRRHLAHHAHQAIASRLRTQLGTRTPHGARENYP